MNCLLQVTGRSKTLPSEPNEAPDITETLTRGICREVGTEDGPGYRFDYRVSEDDNPHNAISCKVTVSAHKAIIERSGALRSTIIVVPGESHSCLYETPYGALSFDIYGSEISLRKEGDSIIASLTYEIYSGGIPTTANEITITATP